MSKEMTTSSIHYAMSRVKGAIISHADELNSLDGAIGDGDLGVTLSRAVEGFSGAPPATNDVGMLLLEYAKLFTGTAGSTYGTLIATGLIAAAKQTQGRSGVPWSEVSYLLGVAGAAMAARGKSQFGDKTVLDAVESARFATQGFNEPAELVSAVVEALRETIREFHSRPFRQGRARIFGEKGIGREDPGMIAFQYIVESLQP